MDPAMQRFVAQEQQKAQLQVLLHILCINLLLIFFIKFFQYICTKVLTFYSILSIEKAVCLSFSFLKIQMNGIMLKIKRFRESLASNSSSVAKWLIDAIMIP